MIFMAAKQGDKVKVDYVGTFDDGTEFDSSKHGDHSHPLEFSIGEGQVIKGFEEAVTGMEKGETKKIRLEPKDAYGEINDQLTAKVPKDQLPKDVEVKEGMMLAVAGPDGHQMPATVTKIEEKEIILDLNHPMAGKVLNFELTMVEFESA